MSDIPDVGLRPSIVVAAHLGLPEETIRAAMREIGRHRSAFSPMLDSGRAGSPPESGYGGPVRYEWFHDDRVITSLVAKGWDDDADEDRPRLDLRRGRAPGMDTHEIIVEMCSMGEPRPDALDRLDAPKTPWSIMACAETCLDAALHQGLPDIDPRIENAMHGLIMEMVDLHPGLTGVLRIHGPSPWAPAALGLEGVRTGPRNLTDLDVGGVSALPDMTRIFVSHRREMTRTNIILDSYSTAIDTRKVDAMHRLRLAAALEDLRNGDLA